MPDFLIYTPPKEDKQHKNYLFFVSQNELAYLWLRRLNKPDHWYSIERVADAFYVHSDLVPIIKREIEEAGFTWQMAIK